MVPARPILVLFILTVIDVQASSKMRDDGNTIEIFRQYYSQKMENLKKMKTVLEDMKRFRDQRVSHEPDRNEFVKNPVNGFRLIHELVRNSKVIESIQNRSEQSFNLFNMMKFDESLNKNLEKVEYKDLNMKLIRKGRLALLDSDFHLCSHSFVEFYETSKLVTSKEVLVSVLDYAIFCHFKDGDHINGLKYSNILGKIDPTHPRLESYKEFFSRKNIFDEHLMNDNVEKFSVELIQNGKDAYYKEEYDMCVMYMKKAVNLDEVKLDTVSMTDCLDHLAYCLFRQNMYKDALRFTYELLKLDPTHQRGLTYKRSFEKIVGSSTEVKKDHLVSANEHLQRAKKLYEDGNFDSCLQHLKNVPVDISSKTNKILTYTLMTYSYFQVGKLRHAYVYVNKLLDEAPEDPWGCEFKRQLETGKQFKENHFDGFLSFLK